MNSFSAMQKAIEFEIARQSELLDAGRGSEIVQETRLWDENKLCTYTMRKWVPPALAMWQINPAESDYRKSRFCA